MTATDAMLRALYALVGMAIRSIGLGVVLICTGALATVAGALIALLYVVVSPFVLVWQALKA